MLHLARLHPDETFSGRACSGTSPCVQGHACMLVTSSTWHQGMRPG
jgi:hypothetical protein